MQQERSKSISYAHHCRNIDLFPLLEEWDGIYPFFTHAWQHKTQVWLTEMEIFVLTCWNLATPLTHFVPFLFPGVEWGGVGGGGFWHWDDRTPRRTQDCDGIITAHHLNVVACGCFISWQSSQLSFRQFRYQSGWRQGAERKRPE